MTKLTIWTLNWVPEGPRGFVRDMRLRWACEEAGLPYDVRTIAFEDRATNHLDRQPFGQVPFLDDGEVRLFESGACVMHIARKNDALMPNDPVGEAETVEWMFAALNSLEMVSVPWWFLGLGDGKPPESLTGWLDSRLAHIERELSKREWLATGRFTAGDLLMADVLRIPAIRSFGDRPATAAYLDRVTSRPAFQKAHAAQMAHFDAGDAARA